MPDEPEALGLLALMLLHDARRRRPGTAPDGRARAGSRTRTGAAGTGGADRGGQAIVDRALRMRRVGPYQLQAAIAAVHDEARHGRRHRLAPDPRAVRGPRADRRRRPVVELNRAVALAQVAGPATGLDGGRCAGAPIRRCSTYRFFHATRADFLRRLERWGESAAGLRRARSQLTANEPERAFLEGRRAEVASRASAG